MAAFFKDILGGAKSSVSSAATVSDDFADFATAAAPQAASHVASSAASAASALSDAAAATATAQSSTPGSFFNINSGSMAGRPYTKWYRVWERVTLADFYQELAIIPILLVIILVNLWGAKANRSRAKDWAKTYLPLLSAEFASVGFGKTRRQPSLEDPELFKEKSKNEFQTYCTGRQNIATLDIKLSLYKRYNPFLWAGEVALSFFFESFVAPVETMEAMATCFDGKEKSLVPAQAQGQGLAVGGSSAYDGFVWAIVHKDKMRALREERYDVSLTTTKDHPKLPAWTTVMSESSEITDALLTPELIKAVVDAGDDLEALIISDQPVDAPRKLNDTLAPKRISLATRLPSSTSPTPSALFTYFLRLPDILVQTAHFRPEAMRKVRATRDDEIRKIRKADEDEKAEERRNVSEKLKKEERERKLSGLSAADQKKFLEKEKDKQQRKQQKKMSMKG